MKKLIMYNILTSISIYTGIYLIKSFIMWELNNPFKWIIDIPTYDPIVRFIILIFYLSYMGIWIIKYFNNKSIKHNL